ncbi:MAG: hypothetical protein IJS94_02285 [Clostridia bacterium]|nr:hypothetical protein [Clostridia bacterium]
MDSKTDKTINEERKNDLRDTLYLVVSALFAWLGCYMFTMRLGAVSSYPFIIVTAVCASVICKKFIRTLVFYALFGFLLPFTASRGINASAQLCVICCVIFTLSFCAVYLFLKKTKKAPLFKTAAVLLAAAALAVHVFFNSDPFTFSKSSDTLSSYIDSNYRYEKLNSSNIYYVFSEKTFMTETAYSKRPTEKAYISVKDGKITDGYVSLTERFMLEEPLQKLTEKIRAAFPDGSFSVTSGSVINYPRGFAVSAESDVDYTPYASFNVYFNKSMNANEFINTAEKYFNAIYESGFKCHDLVFYAGSAGKYYAKIETRFLSMKARFDENSVKNV